MTAPMQGRSLPRGILPDPSASAEVSPPPRRLLFQAGAWTALDLPPLAQKELEPWRPVRVPELLAVAVEEKSIPILDHFARAHDLDLGPDLAGLATVFRIASDRLYARAAPILSELSRTGIPLMLLKGGDVDLSLFRGEPPRTMFDLDFMIPPPAVPQVEETFRAFGFEQGLYDPKHVRILPIPEDQKAELQDGDFELLDFVKIEKVDELEPFAPILRRHADLLARSNYSFACLGKSVYLVLSYDLHTNLSGDFDVADCWNDPRALEFPGGPMIQAQSFSDLLWYLCARFYHETMLHGRRIMRYFFDILRLLTREGGGVDWNRVAHATDRYKLHPSLYFVLSHAREFLPEGVPSELLDAWAPSAAVLSRGHNWGDFVAKMFDELALQSWDPTQRR